MGLRFDRETEEVSDPDIILPTQRTLLTTEICYHFKKWSQSLHNIYVGLGIGYGTSRTTVDGQPKKGRLMSLPFSKIGLLSHLGENIYLITEGGVESLLVTEYFQNSGLEQSTSILNAKITAGVRFDLF